MNVLELKVPPPIVALCLALFMWITSLWVGPIEIPLAFRVGIAVALVIIGQSLCISGMVAFRRARTTVNPLKPDTASSLVTTGVYRFTRNPMYVGLLLTLLACTAFLPSLLSLVFVAIYVVYISRFQIEPEERALSSLFGDEYAAYKQRVRRWI
jgi:protein-S-isoprenylcysteine O-methyltransferase Ste14